VTGDGNAMWTVFGPTNVALHSVSIEMEMGEAGRCPLECLAGVTATVHRGGRAASGPDS
jgi:uncharacterized metal-binding protein